MEHIKAFDSWVQPVSNMVIPPEIQELGNTMLKAIGEPPALEAEAEESEGDEEDAAVVEEAVPTVRPYAKIAVQSGTVKQQTRPEPNPHQESPPQGIDAMMNSMGMGMPAAPASAAPPDYSDPATNSHFKELCALLGEVKQSMPSDQHPQKIVEIDDEDEEVEEIPQSTSQKLIEVCQCRRVTAL